MFNPLQVKLFRQAISLRKTKTDKIDANCIALLLMSESSSPSSVSYQMQELKSLTRHRSRIISLRSKAKIQLTRLLDMLFPELAAICWSTSQKSILALLREYPGAAFIAKCRIDRITNILKTNSRGKYKEDKARQIKQVAIDSIGIESPALGFELQ